jgi:hypothetical protein
MAVALCTTMPKNFRSLRKLSDTHHRGTEDAERESFKKNLCVLGVSVVNPGFTSCLRLCRARLLDVQKLPRVAAVYFCQIRLAQT